MIYWNEYDDYRIIEDENLEKLAVKYDVELNEFDNLDNKINNWFKYAQITSKKNNFSQIYELTFVYYVTQFLAEYGMSCGIEEKYFLRKLDNKIYKIYFNSTKNNQREVDQKRAFYESLVNFFTSEEIKSYEKHIFQHSINVTDDVMEWFKIKGRYGDTINSLIKGQIDKPYLNTNIVGVNKLVFVLTHSEELEWKKLSSINDRDRLRVLLN